MPDKTWKEDNHTIIHDGVYLTTDLQRGVTKGIDGLYSRYLEIMSRSSIPIPDWMSKEDYTLSIIAKGLGYEYMTFSDIINQALVAGGLEVAKFLADIEKELKIT